MLSLDLGHLSHAGAAERALDALSMSVALLDGNGQIVAVNRAWTRFGLENGLSRHQPRHGDYLAVCRAGTEVCAEASAAAAGIMGVLAGTEPGFELEYPCHAPDRKRWFLLQVSPLAGTPPEGAVVAHIDITARKLLEERLQSFASVAAHDLRTPLKNMQALATLLADDGSLSEDARELVGLIDTSARALDGLVGALLDHARVRAPLSLCETDMASVVRQVMDAYTAVLKNLDARIDVHELPVLETDPTLAAQVIRNLVDNAIKYGGRPPHIVIDAVDGPDGHEVRVTDNGSGIPDEDKELVFEPFKQRAGGEGGGLGLSVCRDTVERLGGSMRLEDAPGGGARFVVLLPKRRDQPPALAGS